MSNDHSDLMFTLQDRSGGEHTYVVSPHVGSQGLEVIDAMLAIGMGPLAEAMFSAARAAEAEKLRKKELGQDTEESDIGLSAILDAIDLDNIVESAQTGLTSVGGMTKLAPLVLRYTTRDGQRLIDGQGKRLNTAGMDLAYTRNWREMRDAFMKVMEINGFFAVLAGFFGED